ncbi:hypothetical protein BC940DRAFT_294531 [Gongronella butleri]|nr:hypothetical protein BC940DRAFT_294531 [Gongronella butleri]
MLPWTRTTPPRISTQWTTTLMTIITKCLSSTHTAPLSTQAKKSAKDHVSSKWGLDVSLGKTVPVTIAIDAETNVIEERVTAPVSVVDEPPIAPAQPQEEAEKAEKSETTADDTTVAARSTRTEAPMCAKKDTSGTNIEYSNAKDLPPTSEAERGKVTQTALETDPDSQEKERVPAPPPKEDVIIAAHDTKTTAIVEQSTHSFVADAAAAAAHLESTNITPGVDIDDDQHPHHDSKDEVSTHAIIETDQKVEKDADEPQNEPPAVEQHESPATPLPERLETARTVAKAVNDAAADPPPALASEKDQKKLPLPPASLTNGSNGHHGHAPSKIAAQQIHATQTPANKALPKAATANKVHAKKDKCVMM